MGQFERTLIIVDEGASIHYVEGCTAPLYSKDSLHAAVVEIFIKKGGYCRYSTVQNWSDNIVNLVTKRALCEENATMEWIDGNVGSGLNMKYPACILKGDNSSGTCITISVASEKQNSQQDTAYNHPNVAFLLLLFFLFCFSLLFFLLLKGLGSGNAVLFFGFKLGGSCVSSRLFFQ